MASFEYNEKSRTWSARDRAFINGKDTQFRLSHWNNDKYKPKFNTKREAQQALKQYKDRLDRENYTFLQQLGVQRHSTFRYDELLAEYLNAKVHETKESTQYEKIKVFEMYISPYFKGYDMRTVTKPLLLSWQNNLWNLRKKNGDSYSRAYRIKIRSLFYTFLSWSNMIYDTPNYLEKIPIPKTTESKKEMFFYEHDEIKAFLEKSQKLLIGKDLVFHTLLSTMFYSGLRINEARALTEKDYDGKCLEINKSIIDKTVDGSLYKISETKNYKNRTVPLPEHICKQIDKLILWKRENNVPDEFLFGGYSPFSENTLRRKMDIVTKAAELKRIRIHDMRHSYVSLLAHLNVNTKIIAQLIGDTELMVIQTYSHLYADSTVNAIKLIDQLI